MARTLPNWLLRLVQYYGMVFGFTSINIDVQHKRLNIHKSVKIYAYLINLLYVVATIRFYVYIYTNFIIFDQKHPFLAYAYYTQRVIRTFMLIGIILLRIKEERFVGKWFGICEHLQRTYFDKIAHRSADGTVNIALIINIFNIMAHCLCLILNLITLLLRNSSWLLIITNCSENYFIAMEHYTMLHHALILSYINHSFKMLNNQLLYEEVEKSFLKTYVTFSSLLQQVNNANGPLIFLVLVSLLLAESMYAYSIILFQLFIGHNDLESFIELCTFIIFSINIYLYFLICDRLQNTTKETGQILMELCGRDNDHQEVEFLVLRRLTVKLNVNICGLFTIDLGALFILISEVVTLKIIIVQIEYWTK
ncbi:gustatory receptor 10b [Cochliomyia hominivorax]